MKREMASPLNFSSPFPPKVAFAQRASAAQGSTLSSAVLHPAEAVGLSERAIPKRRREYVAGRLAAHHVLEMLDQRPAPPVIRGADGAPQWPEGTVGAITHTRGWALACAAPQDLFVGLGLDLEHVQGVRRMAIAPKIAQGPELDWIGSSKRRLVAVFSAKEAIYKAIYPSYGAFFGFKAVTLRWQEEVAGLGAAGFEGTLNQALGPQFPMGTRLSVAARWYGDYVLTALWIPA